MHGAPTSNDSPRANVPCTDFVKKTHAIDARFNVAPIFRQTLRRQIAQVGKVEEVGKLDFHFGTFMLGG